MDTRTLKGKLVVPPVRSHLRRRDERGDTLIELLVAIVIISMTVTALLGALVTAVTASGEHRSLAVEDTLLKSYADAAELQIELGAPPKFQTCAPLSVYQALSVPMPPGYLGYVVQITGISYWSKSSASFVTSCPTTPPYDSGLQLISVSAVGRNVTKQLSFVVRNPGYAPPS